MHIQVRCQRLNLSGMPAGMNDAQAAEIQIEGQRFEPLDRVQVLMGALADLDKEGVVLLAVLIRVNT